MASVAEFKESSFAEIDKVENRENLEKASRNAPSWNIKPAVEAEVSRQDAWRNRPVPAGLKRMANSQVN